MDCVNTRGRTPDRSAAVVLLVTALSTGLGLAGESWGEAKIVHIGVLTFVSDTSGEQGPSSEVVRQTLAAHGWIEGKNLSLDFRTASGDPPRFDEPALELVRRKVDVIVATGAPGTRAAYGATRVIPIVALDFTNDPVAAGYVESYGRPGGNLTGVFLDAPGFAAKWIELLRAFAPRLSRAAVLWDPSAGDTHLRALRAATPALGIRLQVLEVRKPNDLDRAFAAVRGRPQALIILPSPMTWGHSARLAKLAREHRLLATSMAPEFAASGGALTYGPDLASSVERLAILATRVVGGAAPADLPIERPAKFNLIVNLRTVEALGFKAPDSVLVRADQVIR